MPPTCNKQMNVTKLCTDQITGFQHNWSTRSSKDYWCTNCRIATQAT